MRFGVKGFEKVLTPKSRLVFARPTPTVARRFGRLPGFQHYPNKEDFGVL
jgi:hypothetical protein